MPSGPGNATSVVSSRAAGPADPARRGGGPHGSTWAAVPLPSPLAPPLPRQPEAERSSEGPLLSSRVTPVPRGPRKGGRTFSWLEASSPRLTWFGPGGASPSQGRGGRSRAGPTGLIRPSVRPAGFRLFARLAALPGPRWWHWLEKQPGQEWKVFSGHPRGSRNACAPSTWPGTSPNLQPGPTAFAGCPPCVLPEGIADFLLDGN